MPLRYVLRRLLFLIGVIWTAATLNFILPHLTPRDPVLERVAQLAANQGLVGSAAQEFVDSQKKLFGLDRPLSEQYIDYITRMMRFDLGFSMNEYPRTVNNIIATNVWWTLGLVGTATVLAFLIGTILGALLGWHKSPRAVSALIPPLMVFSATPSFVVALIFIYFLAFRAKLFPLGRPYDVMSIVDWSNWKFLLNVLHHAVLPAFSLVVVAAGGWGLGMRAMTITVEGEDYMTFGEAKGLKGSRLFLRYALRNALLPQITGLAVQLGGLVSGSTLVEVYFNYPGLGNRLNAAIQSLDYFVISGIVFFLVAGIALATFIMDMIYPLLDPRITYQRGT